MVNLQLDTTILFAPECVERKNFTLEQQQQWHKFGEKVLPALEAHGSTTSASENYFNRMQNDEHVCIARIFSAVGTLKSPHSEPGLRFIFVGIIFSMVVLYDWYAKYGGGEGQVFG